MRVSIIGAGIGGLATACLLAAKGNQVSVFEKNSGAGGKLNIFEKQGFHFDTGPSLLTMKDILEKLFELTGERLSDHLNLTPLEPICRYNYQDGVSFDCFEDKEATIREIAKFAPEDAKAYPPFLNYCSTLYTKTDTAFIRNPLFDFSDVKNLNVPSFFGIDAFTTVSKSVDKAFQSEYLRMFFKRFTTYNGSSPFQAPATLNVIPHVELNQGGYYIKGGMYRLTVVLEELALKLGVQFHFNSPVEEIVIEKSQTKGVRSQEKYFHSDIVIANSDSTETILNLIGDDHFPKRKKEKASKIEPSCSGFVLLLGIDKQYDQLVHHNIFFSKNYEHEFHQIFKEKVMPDDPTIYIANTSFSDPAHAPEGGSNLFVLVNAPYLSEYYSWENHVQAYSKKVIQGLEQRGLDGLSDAIVVQESITPEDFYHLYLSNKGSIYGTSSNSKFSAFVRPRNKSRHIDKLYFVGGSTHPGGGIPLVVQSAFNAVELIDRYEV
ncbi:MAG: phytoene desaturase [Balneola sp.]|nr:MAG: phytoene desaturase [Balneola sp.]